MKPVRSITWLPEAICEEIAQEVDRLVANWAGVWGIASTGAARAELVPAREACAHDFVDLLADWPIAGKRALAQALFKFDAYGSSLADAVMGSVITALQTSLRTAFGEVQTADELPGSIGHVGVVVIAEILGQRSGLMLSCEQLRACGKLKWPTPATLVAIDMERTLSDVPVPLTARLGRADVNLEELMQLSPGDVLLLDEGINSPLQVVSPGSSLKLSAHLGLSPTSAMRAVRWLPPLSDAQSQ